MKIKNIVVFESDGAHIRDNILEAYHLAGVASWSETDARRKPYGQLRAGEVDVALISQAISNLRQVAREMRDNAKRENCPYPEQPGANVAQIWVDGELSAANQIDSKVTRFHDDVTDALCREVRFQI